MKKIFKRKGPFSHPDSSMAWKGGFDSFASLENVTKLTGFVPGEES